MKRFRLEDRRGHRSEIRRRGKMLKVEIAQVKKYFGWRREKPTFVFKPWNVLSTLGRANPRRFVVAFVERPRLFEPAHGAWNGIVVRMHPIVILN